jgi:5-methyltetrahydrofolate--homocysteine methyltransferase
MSNFSELSQAIIDARKTIVIELVKDAVGKNVAAQSLLSEHMIPAMLEVGRLMEDGEYFIPEVLQSAKAMKAGMDIIEPILLESGSGASEGYVILGTVEGDIHDIGKNLVGTLLKGSGFEVLDLGTSVPKEKFLEAAQAKDGAIVIGMSALITPTLDGMPEVIKLIEDAGIRDRVKIMVGGAAVTEEFADSIGADGTSRDAAGAVRLAKDILGK